VSRYFSELEEMPEKRSFYPSRIISAHKTGASCIHANSKALSVRGKKEVGKLTWGGRPECDNALYGYH
jgi:hypothetical protein